MLLSFKLSRGYNLNSSLSLTMQVEDIQRIDPNILSHYKSADGTVVIKDITQIVNIILKIRAPLHIARITASENVTINVTHDPLDPSLLSEFLKSSDEDIGAIVKFFWCSRQPDVVQMLSSFYVDYLKEILCLDGYKVEYQVVQPYWENTINAIEYIAATKQLATIQEIEKWIKDHILSGGRINSCHIDTMFEDAIHKYMNKLFRSTALLNKFMEESVNKNLDPLEKFFICNELFFTLNLIDGLIRDLTFRYEDFEDFEDFSESMAPEKINQDAPRRLVKKRQLSNEIKEVDTRLDICKKFGINDLKLKSSGQHKVFHAIKTLFRVIKTLLDESEYVWTEPVCALLSVEKSEPNLQKFVTFYLHKCMHDLLHCLGEETGQEQIIYYRSSIFVLASLLHKDDSLKQNFMQQMAGALIGETYFQTSDLNDLRKHAAFDEKVAKPVVQRYLELREHYVHTASIHGDNFYALLKDKYPEALQLLKKRQEDPPQSPQQQRRMSM